MSNLDHRASHRRTSASVVRNLHYEWRRMISLRSTWGLAVLSLVAALLVCWGFSLVLANQEVDASQAEAAMVLITRSPLTLLVPALLGTLAATSDHRYGLALVTQSIMPRRWQAPLLRAVVAAVFSSVLVGICVVATAFLAVATMGGQVDVLRVAPQLVLFVGLGAGWAAIGVSVGTTIRTQGVALSLLVFWPFTVEPLIRLLTRSAKSDRLNAVMNLLPASAGESAIRPNTPYEGSLLPGGPELTPAWLGALAFATFVLASLAVAATVNDRRDAML